MKFIAPLFLMLAVALPAFADELPQTPSVIVYIQGVVKVQRGSGEVVTAALGTEVRETDAVITEDSSQARVRLYDRSLIRLGANSKAQMAQLRSDASAEKKTISVKLVVGRLWASVSKLLSSDSSFEVQTSSAVAGVRGTNFGVLMQSPDSDCEIQVGEGSVNVKAGGEQRLIGAGKAAIVGLNGFRAVRDLGVSQTAMLLDQARGSGGGGGGDRRNDRAADGGKAIGDKVDKAAANARDRMAKGNAGGGAPRDNQGPGAGQSRDHKPRVGGAQDVIEQRQRGSDVFQKANDRAAATRLKAIIEVRE
ncbi:MAG: FecR domain-containing protein [Deltaproteobacteria bacterium]|nr:FecR domain-containing protein [Deltaproteobacteria bacterium]